MVNCGDQVVHHDALSFDTALVARDALDTPHIVKRASASRASAAPKLPTELDRPGEKQHRVMCARNHKAMRDATLQAKVET